MAGVAVLLTQQADPRRMVEHQRLGRPVHELGPARVALGIGPDDGGAHPTRSSRPAGLEVLLRPGMRRDEALDARQVLELAGVLPGRRLVPGTDREPLVAG